jgi:iron-sulfur cluster assembly accessory protein
LRKISNLNCQICEFQAPKISKIDWIWLIRQILRCFGLQGGGFGPNDTSVTVNYRVGNETLIKVRDGASDRLLSLLKKQGRLETGALRIAVIGGGCSGLQYKMDLVDGPANRDILVESNQVRVVIDPKSALFVTGSELDFSDDLQQGGFKVTNPNAVVTCSCGESFSA